MNAIEQFMERFMERGAVILGGAVELRPSTIRFTDRGKHVLERAYSLPDVQMTSGLSQYLAKHALDHFVGKTSFTMPATVALALLTSAPASTDTGGTVAEATYTGYGRQTIAGSGFNAATTASPSVSTNNGAITFAACTGGTSTLLGYALLDSGTTGAGNVLIYGSLSSTVISTTQTPATVADTALSTSLG